MKIKSEIWLLLYLFAWPLTSCSGTAVPISSKQADSPTAAIKMESSRTETPGPTITINLQATGTPTIRKPVIAASQTPALVVTKPTQSDSKDGKEAMKTIFLQVGSSTFSAALYDNETSRALLSQFPLNLNMSDLNGREKYYHLSQNLPAAKTEMPATIHAGEIMLWSSNSLVLFYKTFSNSYGGYVKLGYVEDSTGLAAALGSGNVQVTFTVSQ